MRAIARPLFAAFLATLGLAIALGLRPIPVDRIVVAYVLVIAALAVTTLTRLARDFPGATARSSFESALRRDDEPQGRPPELVRVERELGLGMARAGRLHTHLLPMLREAAAPRLAARRGIELDRRPEAARAALGDEAWELLRPDRPPPADPNAPGISKRRVTALIDSLERL
ncbi:MAG TPA: hypothetical protein VGF23_00525 [Gaiellaceae bacterium]